MRTIKDFLLGATKLPVAIESKLPAGAPKISKVLVDTATKLPAGPNFPVELPDLPDPKLPTLPNIGGGGAAALCGLAPRPSGTRGRLSQDYTPPPSAVVGARGKL